MIPAVAGLLLNSAVSAAAVPAERFELGQFVERALDSSVALRSAEIDAANADLRYQASRATFRPKLVPFYSLDEPGDEFSSESFGASVEWDTGWGVLLGVSTSRAESSFGGDPSLSTDFRSVDVTIPVGGRSGRLPAATQLEEARFARLRAGRQLDEARQATTLEILDTYYATLEARQALAVTRDSVERARANFELSRLRFDLGDVSRVDLDRAQQALLQAEGGEVAAATALVMREEVLRNRFGVRDPASLGYSLPDADGLVLSWTVEDVFREAWNRTSAVVSIREEIAVAEKRFKLARRDLLPSLEVSFRASRREDQFAGEPALVENAEGILISSNLSLDYADRRLVQAEADSRLLRLRLGLLDREQSLRALIASELDAFRRKVRLLEINRASVETVRRQMEVAALRFEKGIGTAFDVVDAQAQLRSAELQLLRSRVDHVLGYYTILYRMRRLEPSRLIP